MEVTRVGDDRAIGAIVAVGIGVVNIFVVLRLASPGFDPLPVSDQPFVLVAIFGFLAIVGWWAGAAAVRDGKVQAALVGIGVGIAWGPLAVLVSVATAFVDAVLRGGTPVSDVGGPLAWALYGLVLGVLFTSAIGIPIGIAWAAATRSVVSMVGTRESDRPGVRHPTMIALTAFLLLAATTGATLAISDRRPGERCLDVDGGRPLDGAFSPAGDRLAVVSSNDLNEGGTIHLIAWPSGETLASWSTWADQDVAIGPDGRVYWSAWEYQPPWRGGVMTAAIDSAPQWLTTGEETGLWSLVWTTSGLRGVTGYSHELARIRLDKGSDRRLERLKGVDDGGAFWSSSDDRIAITSPEWNGDHVTVTGPDGLVRPVPVVGDPRSIALSADGNAVIVASWFGGTRRYDIASGHSEGLLRRSQVWVAVSSKGDLAWADDEQFGPGRVCIAPIGR